MESIVATIASVVVDNLVGPLKKHSGYVFYSNSIIQNLKEQGEKLRSGRDRVLHDVDHARRKGEEIEADVKSWLEKVEVIIVETERFLNDETRANKRCFIRLCPNLNSRYQDGKKASKEMKDIIGLLAEGKFGRVSYQSSLPSIGTSAVKGYESFESRMSTLKNILEALADPSISMVGVFGMGGVGKTTLVKEVARQAKEEKLFDGVVLAVVSQTPDTRMIQGEIADQLGLECHKESKFGRARILCQRLKKDGKILVILDDIWERLDLEAIGIPFGNDHKGCKILLTSRSQDVLGDMDTEADFSIGVLPEKEAWDLFKKMAGDCVQKTGLQSIALEVAKECAGLPIAIAAVGRALRSKSSFEWKNALRQLRRPSSRNFTGFQAVVYSAMELSYNHLEGEELKSTILLCGLMGYTYDASVLDLLKYGMGLGLFQGVATMEEARDRVYTLVRKLKASCLLLDSYSNEMFSMHDVVRNVAISIASKEQHVFVSRNDVGMKEWPEKDKLKDCHAISLHKSDISELPEDLECPKLKFFYMFKKDISMRLPDNFFTGMRELRVLDLTKMCFDQLPSSLHLLENLATLCLDQCELGNIAIIGQLKNLEILSLFSSDIERLPGEIAQLTRLRMLDMTDCSKLKEIPRNVISSMSRLEELYMGNCFVQWEVEGLNNQRSNACLAELKQLRNLTGLDIHIKDGQIMPKDLLFDKLERYRIFVGDVWDWSGKYGTSRTLKVKLETSIHLQHGISMLLKKSEDLYLDELKGIKDVLYELDKEGFPRLKHLHIQNGQDVKHIINTFEWVLCNAFPILESMSLLNLINLKNICHGELTAESFSKLRILKVGSCDRLRNLLSYSMAKGLLQLQEIEVTNCKSIQQIIAEGSDQEDANRTEVVDKIEYTQLRSMTLQFLPQLTDFCSKANMSSHQRNKLLKNETKEIIFADEQATSMPLFNGKIVFPNIEALKLSSINIISIWHNQLQSEPAFFQNLASLIVEGCGGLTYLVSSSMARSLVKLKHLEISDCKIMETVVNADESGEKGKGAKMLPNLRFLKMKDLQNLTRFCSKDYVEFASLKQLRIEHCPLLQSFVQKAEGIEMAAARISALFNDLVAFPTLETINISHLDNLKMIWNDQLPINSFCKLKTMKVEHCEKLLTLFPSHILGRILRLETLTITDCSSLEVVFDLQGLIAEDKNATMASLLRKIHIERLSELKHLWNKDPEGMIVFPILNSVTAVECNSLRSLFPISMARNLLQLQELEIRNCGIKHIVSMQDGEKAEARFVFPRLTCLKLWEVPELKSLCPGKHTSEWPALKKIQIHDHDKVKIFSSELLGFLARIS